LSPDLLSPVQFAGLGESIHGVSTRHGGVSPAPYASLNLGLSTGDSEARVLENRRRFACAVGIDPERVVAARMSHGNRVSVFRSDRADRWPVERDRVRAGSSRTETVFRSDAVISDVHNLYLFLTFADCVPILLFDPRSGAVAAAHAGWRGTAEGIAGEVVRAMTHEFGSRPAELRAAIGPSIGPCCYTVGPEVTERFAQTRAAAELVHRQGATVLDLWASNERQLAQAGLDPGAIENHRLCTSCRVDVFYSHRREAGKTGRIGLFIGASG
jgi:polyphenol oxidase